MPSDQLKMFAQYISDIKDSMYPQPPINSVCQTTSTLGGGGGGGGINCPNSHSFTDSGSTKMSEENHNIFRVQSYYGPRFFNNNSIDTRCIMAHTGLYTDTRFIRLCYVKYMFGNTNFNFLSFLDTYSISQEIYTRFLLCFVVVIHWLIFPYPSGLLHWHCGNLTIAPVPAKQPWWIWINTSCQFIMNDGITTTKQSTTKPCAYFLGYTVDG